MSKEEILKDMLVKYEAYVNEWKCPVKWEAYKAAWSAWRAVKGDS